jgi:hypothetical protein
LALSTAVAQQREVISLNHVAIAAGLRRRFSVHWKAWVFRRRSCLEKRTGLPLAYFQSTNTFIELMPVTLERPAGVVHFGLEVTQLDELVRRLRAAGMEVRDPVVSSRTGPVLQ